MSTMYKTQSVIFCSQLSKDSNYPIIFFDSPGKFQDYSTEMMMIERANWWMHSTSLMTTPSTIDRQAQNFTSASIGSTLIDDPTCLAYLMTCKTDVERIHKNYILWLKINFK